MTTKTTVCDYCRKEIHEPFHKLSVGHTEENTDFEIDYDICNSCIAKVSRLLRGQK